LKRLSILFFVLLAAAAAAAMPDAYVLGEGNTQTAVGDEIDFALLGKLPEKYGEHYLWMRHGGKTWVVRDRKAIERAKEIMKPQSELNAKRADISRRQIPLSQDAAKYSTESALLGAELARRSTAGDEAKVAELQAKLGVIVGKMRELRAKQDGLDQELRGVVQAQEKLQPELIKTFGAYADDLIAKEIAKAE
jgi:hypothetical protein